MKACGLTWEISLTSIMIMVFTMICYWVFRDFPSENICYPNKLLNGWYFALFNEGIDHKLMFPNFEPVSELKETI